MTTPDTIGPQLERAAAGTDPRGILVFSWLPTELQNTEDSTQAADKERSNFRARGFERPASDAEVTLLRHLGYQVDDGLVTFVRYKSRSVRHRSWPSLEGQQP